MVHGAGSSDAAQSICLDFLGSICTAIEGKVICGPENLLKVCRRIQFLLFMLQHSIKQHRSGSSEHSFGRQEGLSTTVHIWAVMEKPLKPISPH